MRTHLDLFSGIGGFALAADWANFRTIGFCEIDAECQRVLAKHWPHIPIHEDITQLDGSHYEGIFLLTGGYPCQPFSVAGTQKAHEDHRHLWPEMRRIIAQAKPTWIICENVYGHVTLGLDSVLNDLEADGYATQSFVVPSLSTGRNHNRDRVYIVAYSASHGRDDSAKSRRDEQVNEWASKRKNDFERIEGRSSVWVTLDGDSYPIGRRGTEPPPLRVDAQLPRRMDRNRMLGNAIDPLIAYEFMRMIE